MRHSGKMTRQHLEVRALHSRDPQSMSNPEGDPTFIVFPAWRDNGLLERAVRKLFPTFPTFPDVPLMAPVGTPITPPYAGTHLGYINVSAPYAIERTKATPPHGNINSFFASRFLTSSLPPGSLNLNLFLTFSIKGAGIFFHQVPEEPVPPPCRLKTKPNSLPIM